ncbi:sialate O-acetylesterase [Arenibacter sp. S6351L]|uniref:sialate O-acetylesterase n=1 Tax=Arenibacter sp. S6351L TaxID=2926407 RepID=UPI001FF14BBD|nr:sialate O-acetylesterase [Arenibacter sp. S6351L]MCK0133357.1 sialate O-acetylesterase [Arenibacter sp. S6351L]
MTKKPFILVQLVFLLFYISVAHSQELKPSNLFCDNMVLQRGMEVPVWGVAAPKERITVKFAGQTTSTKAGKDGKWMVELEPMQASKIPREMTISGKTEIVLSNVVVGEVWICSGQSNMQFSVDNVPETKALLASSKNIRSFEVKRTVSFKEEDNVSGKWADVPPSSAVAFGFAYFLEKSADIPIGIIHASWGSSSLEAWMPRDMSNEFPYFKAIIEDLDADTVTRNRINSALSGDEGWSTKEDIFMRRQPNILFNAMMKPLAPYACRGLVWYQGERNTRYYSGVPEVNEDNWYHRVIGMKEYGDVLQSWIRRYRKEWKNNEMHFSVVMLPGYGKGTNNNPDIDPKSPTALSWAWMRESQMKVLELPYTSVVNTIDLGDETNVHPKDKLPIGVRLALQAEKETLNKDVVAEGPILDEVKAQNNALVVYFKNAHGLKTIDGKAPTGFWIADGSMQWEVAETELEGETVVLSNDKIKKPLFVRYAFAGKPEVNLVNGADLPAYPFRTDNEIPLDE